MTEEKQPQEPHTISSISPAVAEAMARLAAMRAERGIVAADPGAQHAPAEVGAPTPVADDQAEAVDVAPPEAVEVCTIVQTAEDVRRRTPIDEDARALPPALSWALKNAIKLQNERRSDLDRSRYITRPIPSSQDGPGRAQRAAVDQFPTVSPQSGPEGQISAAGLRSEGHAVEIRVYPDMTALAHKQRKDAQCRVYLHAQSINTTGSGRVELAQLRETLADAYTWRRIRQIIAGGAGVFWTRIEDVIYLHRPDRVIRAMGGGRMTSRPVLIDARHLRAGMHEYRAVFVFGAFLSGRNRAENPVSQATVREATGAAESTQRTYYGAAGVSARRGIKLVGIATAARLQEAHWQGGRSVFQFIDFNGRHGAPGQKYIAQSIGNIYQSSLERAAAGRFGKIQKCLGSFNESERDHKRTRIYFPDGSQAWRAYDRCKVDRAYYSGPALRVDVARPARLGGVAVFIAVPGMELHA